jgi:hypothetical protein
MRICTFAGLAMLSALAAKTAEGQVIVGRGGGGISVNVPGLGGVRLGVPGVYARPYVSRRIVVAPYGVAPYGPYGYGYSGSGYPLRNGLGVRYAARTYGAAPSLPTEGELRSMTDSDLLNSLAALTAQLDADLNRFDTADTWQRYLGLPEDALPPASEGRVVLGMNSLGETLTRFDRTVAKPEFVQISGLPSFSATHAALAEAVRRFGGQDTQGATADPQVPQEANRRIPPPLPTPPQPGPVADAEPRSIEMRNFHAAAAAMRSGGSTSSGVATAADADADPPSSNGEELPAPPPSLVAPQNDNDAERSILAD